MLHTGGSDQIFSFDAAAGDRLDLTSLFQDSNLNIGIDMARLANHVIVVSTNDSDRSCSTPPAMVRAPR
jgi:hypothetical protein